MTWPESHVELKTVSVFQIFSHLGWWFNATISVTDAMHECYRILKATELIHFRYLDALFRELAGERRRGQFPAGNLSDSFGNLGFGKGSGNVARSDLWEGVALARALEPELVELLEQLIEILAPPCFAKLVILGVGQSLNVGWECLLWWKRCAPLTME